jgi:hypothetical protein
MRRSQKPLFFGLKMPFRMAPATADADCVRAGISRKSIESAATASSKNGPTAGSASAGCKRRRETEAQFGAAKRAMRRRLATAAGAEQIRDPKSRLRLRTLAGAADRESPSYEMALEFSGLKSAACGSPPRRAYRPDRRCGRVAEGGGLLNRYRVVKPYRGFESLRLRHPASR